MTRTAQGRKTAETFAALRQYFGFSDQKLADLAGYTVSQVEWRRKGKTPLNVDDFDRFGAVFNVSPEVFLMEPSDALRWVLDHDITIDAARNHYGRRWAVVTGQGQDSEGDIDLLGGASRWNRPGRHLTLVRAAA